MKITQIEVETETCQLLNKEKSKMADEATQEKDTNKNEKMVDQTVQSEGEANDNIENNIDIVLEKETETNNETESTTVLNVKPLDMNENQMIELPEAPQSLKLQQPAHNQQQRRQSNEDSKTEFDTVSLSEPFCRVCQCNGTEERLISPCSCSGSVKWIHESCLIQWMKSSLKESCELCTKKIKITKRRKPLTKWKLPSQRPTPVLWVLVFVTAIALNLASVVKDASKLCSTTPCLVFYAVGCIGVILGTLFLIYWSKRAKVFINHWIELNEEWVIIVEQEQIKEKSGIDAHILYRSSEKADEKSSHCTININI